MKEQEHGMTAYSIWLRLPFAILPEQFNLCLVDLTPQSTACFERSAYSFCVLICLSGALIRTLHKCLSLSEKSATPFSFYWFTLSWWTPRMLPTGCFTRRDVNRPSHLNSRTRRPCCGTAPGRRTRAHGLSPKLSPAWAQVRQRVRVGVSPAQACISWLLLWYKRRTCEVWLVDTCTLGHRSLDTPTSHASRHWHASPLARRRRSPLARRRRS